MIKKCIPKALLKRLRPIYHGAISYAGHWWYGRPSESMRVIGVTGTKGKSSVTYMLYSVLSQAGYKVGLSSSIYASTGTGLSKNTIRNSMPGRFRLHAMMRQARDAGCEIFIIEVTSEGLAQNRHRGIHFDIAAITNLYPEHLEAHGGFENYRAAKGLLFTALARSKNKILHGGKVPQRVLLNQDDKHSHYYARLGHYPISWISIKDGAAQVRAYEIQLKNGGSSFEMSLGDVASHAHLNLPGKFNIYNSLFVAGIAAEVGMSLPDIVHQLEHISGIAGRMEIISHKPMVIVDYAHIPDALEQVYHTIRDSLISVDGRIIAILGSCGGGRDTWKRKPMGEVAGKLVDSVIVTDEDPYDENPQDIIDEVFAGVLTTGKQEGANAFRILSRREAIIKALHMAKKQDVIIITGKGSESSIIRANGVKEPWSDTEVAREVLASR